MSSVRYKQVFEEVVRNNRKLFDEFEKAHQRYKSNPEKYQGEFNAAGAPVLRLIEEAENHLCGKMEGAGRGMYSANLAEKFRQEIRKTYPMIDMIGMKIS
jgi:hypothetical protein